MRSMVELTSVNTDLETRWLADLNRRQQASSSRAVDMRNIEEDDMEMPIDADNEEEEDMDEAAETRAAQVNTGIEPAGLYSPVCIPVAAVREFYERRNNKPGTRIVFNNGAARVVKETYGEVKTAFEAAYTPDTSVPAAGTVSR